MTNEAAERLRRMKPEDDWGDKFYAATEALWWALKGTTIPAQGTAPHIVMAGLIDDAAAERRATVERIRAATRKAAPKQYQRIVEGQRWLNTGIPMERVLAILDEEAAR